MRQKWDMCDDDNNNDVDDNNNDDDDDKMTNNKDRACGRCCKTDHSRDKDVTRRREIACSTRMSQAWRNRDPKRGFLLVATDIIDISNTQYGREIALKKRKLEAAADKFSKEERDAM